MKVTTTQVAKAARKRAIERIAAKNGVSTDVVVGCLAAGHRRMNQAFDALVCAGIETILTLAEQGRLELITA